MRWAVLLVVPVLVLSCGLGVAEEMTSHLGHKGPAYSPGMTPQSLGWGPKEKAYPDKFVINPSDGAEMAWVPPGEFLMGSNNLEEHWWAYEKVREVIGKLASPETFAGESPAHRVQITRGFWMYRHEVTNAQFRRFKPTHPTDLKIEGLSLSGSQQPAVGMTSEEAKHYCEENGAQLPTEAQWEYACRAGSVDKFWWGDSEAEAGKYANVADRYLQMQFPSSKGILDTDDGYAATAPVGSFLPNAFGIYDMIGNVWEWCADWYGEDYYKGSPGSDPVGPATGEWRVLRGGSWDDYPSNCRSAARSKILPRRRNELSGFRAIARSE